jgi:4'-phosphopantetheinyl transferase EntD
MNFTPQEIAYCILQAEPYSSFAGLFAAKEALVKADASLRERAFHQIGIGHSPEGRPVYPGYTLSIAHANGTAVAVAARGGNGFVIPPLTAPAPSTAGRNGVIGSRLAWVAVLLAVAALIIVLLR